MEHGMLNQGFIYLVAGVGWLVAFFLGKYIFPEMKNAIGSAMNLLSAYPMLQKWGISACQYVAQYFNEISGEEKNKKAAEIIMEVSGQVGIKITEEQARTIAQAAFEAMKNGEREASKTDASDKEGVKENAQS